MEPSVPAWQCPGRQIAGREVLAHEVETWNAERDRLRVKIEGCFLVADARRELAPLYPQRLIRDSRVVVPVASSRE
jgi:hypothetical protein